jgi:hypothetical protein
MEGICTYIQLYTKLGYEMVHVIGGRAMSDDHLIQKSMQEPRVALG